MRVLVTGAGGQLGLELVAAVPVGVDLLALDRSSLDITKEEQVRRHIAAELPDVVLNAAAYTAVDGAEANPEAARAANTSAVGILTEAAADVGARLIHVSTDFVFDGLDSRPYRHTDEPNPTSVYARTKLGGEQAALAGPDSVVVRTSRVYSHLGRNFVTSMLDLMESRDELRVVDDQVGAPTLASGLARVLWAFALRQDLTGLWHWTDSGSCSWFEWACAIQEGALERSMLERTVPIHPIPNADYPTPASRPAYSVLDCSETISALDVQQRPWRDALGTMLDQMASSKSDHTVDPA